MASIVDSVKSVLQDNYSLLKIGGFSILICFIYGFITQTDNFSFANLFLFLSITFLYLGFSSIIINNRIHQRIETLPGFDVVLYFSVARKAFFVAMPYLIIGHFVVNLVVGMFSFEGVPQIVSVWMIRYFILTIYATALIAFSNNYEIKEAMNVSTVLTGLPDVMAYTMVSIIFLSILGVFIAAPILFLVHKFFEFGSIFSYVVIFFLSIVIAFISDFWGQMHYDIESKNNIY